MFLPKSDYQRLVDRLRSLGIRSLEEYRRGEWWRSFRSSMIHEGAHCASCGKGKWLQLHHRQYTNLGRETSKDVVWLCWYCHELVHKTAFSQGVCIRKATSLVIRGMRRELPEYKYQRLDFDAKSPSQIERENRMKQAKKKLKRRRCYKRSKIRR